MQRIIFLLFFMAMLQSFAGAENDVQIFKNMAAKHFCKKFQNVQYSKTYFDKLHDKCKYIVNLENTKINQSNIGKFAEKYMEWYRENKITIKNYDNSNQSKIVLFQEPNFKRIDTSFELHDNNYTPSVKLYTSSTSTVELNIVTKDNFKD